MERGRKLSLYFIVAQFAISIYLLKTRIHGIGTHLRLSLSAILNPLVCCETQHSNQNRSSHWLKREFRDVKDVLIYWDIPDCLFGRHHCNSIHVQYTRIDSSRLRALTTRLTGSLAAGGSGHRAYRK